MKKILAFFGAFNPPTVAHVALGRFAMEQTGREGVIYVPSKSDYIAGDQGKSFAFSDKERLSMLQAIAADNPWMLVSDRELRLKRQPRTYQSLCYLREKGYNPSLLMGSDKLSELQHGWKYVEEIAAQFGIVCMCRGGDDVKQMLQEDPYLHSLSRGITVIQTPENLRTVSSTRVRNLLKELSGQIAPDEAGRLRSEVEQLVPPEAVKIILTNNMKTRGLS